MQTLNLGRLLGLLEKALEFRRIVLDAVDLKKNKNVRLFLKIQKLFECHETYDCEYA